MKKEENHILIRVEALAGEHLLVHALGVAFAICILAYLYFVGLSIMNVIAHREASVQSERLQSVVSTLEQDYFKLSESITPAMGSIVGLAPSEETYFVRAASGVAINQTAPVSGI